MFNVNIKDTKTALLTSFWVSLLLALNIKPSSSDFTVDFEQVNDCWAGCCRNRDFI